jgi:NAD-dependent DNA ligase
LEYLLPNLTLKIFGKAFDENFPVVLRQNSICPETGQLARPSFAKTPHIAKSLSRNNVTVAAHAINFERILNRSKGRAVEPASLASNIRILESKLFLIPSLTFVEFFASL